MVNSIVKKNVKVGIPTELLRKASRNALGLKVVNGSINGVSVELIQDSVKPFYYGSVEISTNVNVLFNGKVIVDSVKPTTNNVWLNNKSLAKKIISKSINEFEIDGLIINLNGEATSKYVYHFYSNENEYTLEENI